MNDSAQQNWSGSEQAAFPRSGKTRQEQMSSTPGVGGKKERRATARHGRRTQRDQGEGASSGPGHARRGG